MNTSLLEITTTLNHSKAKRNSFANLILDTPELLSELIDICYQVDHKISCKATWGLEFLCKKKLEQLLPQLNRFILLLPLVHQHPAVRPIAKICEYLILEYYQQKSKPIKANLNKKHRQNIAESCFDWLITDQKVAAKAYAITCLYFLGTEFEWIHPELKLILEQGYHNNSAAYKARARMILKKIG